MSLIPFVIWNPDLFFLRGPFAVQSLYLHPAFMVIVVLIAVYAGWAAANKFELFYGTGIVLLAAVLISFLTTAADEGFYGAVFGDRFDVSYFIFCIPYFILGMYEYRVDYYLGKIMPADENS